jgi:DEAD/DEAH box helicase domain-containing protein
MSIGELLERWHSDNAIYDAICAWRTVPSQNANFRPLPEELHPKLIKVLKSHNIQALYSHQATAWDCIRQGKNIIISTGTATGKTLCYNLPVIDCLFRDHSSHALYIYPTKALAHDQLSVIQKILNGCEDESSISIGASIYDGDTPPHIRSRVRNISRLILTNPDMLHIGILPYHTQWFEFFSNLQFIIIDEVHTYRGVFGSHVANVIRRLKRIVRFYGSSPKYILTSATIGNPIELSEKLIDAQVTLIDQDGSAHGARNFLIYNPPIVNPELGLRASLAQEAFRLVKDLYSCQIQTILFGRSRHMIEMMLKSIQEMTDIIPSKPNKRNKDVRGYRSGYLPRERREIEHGLRSGDVRLVIATNALELGIDIGNMGAAIIAGYPGSVAATYQQAGRAGRGEEESLAVLITASSPLDQFLAHHPEYFFERSPEQAFINPNHLVILINHMQCAVFELPFEENETFGDIPTSDLFEVLNYLVEAGILHQSNHKYFWKNINYPAEKISLRSTSQDRVLLETDEGIIGEIDKNSAYWMIHPGAIYLHEAQPFLVEILDLENNVSHLKPFQGDYYTEPKSETTVQLLQVQEQRSVSGANIYVGEILVTNHVVGFQKINWQTREILTEHTLDLPPTNLQTTGYWLNITQEAIDRLREEGVWLGEPNYYGMNWEFQRKLARARDHYRCQLCGAPEIERAHHVHHKIPFRLFTNAQEANDLANLVTLCPSCHHKVESAVRIRSGLAGLSFTIAHLAPLFLMCDSNDLGAFADVQSPLSNGQPTVLIYDQAPGGIGFSRRLYEIHSDLIQNSLSLVEACECNDGCPSCVGPGGEKGEGGKRETLAILKLLNASEKYL